jgi:hypothetical protein
MWRKHNRSYYSPAYLRLSTESGKRRVHLFARLRDDHTANQSTARRTPTPVFAEITGKSSATDVWPYRDRAIAKRRDLDGLVWLEPCRRIEFSGIGTSHFLSSTSTFNPMFLK